MAIDLIVNYWSIAFYKPREYLRVLHMIEMARRKT
jgi:hypothetical protein